MNKKKNLEPLINQLSLIIENKYKNNNNLKEKSILILELLSLWIYRFYFEIEKKNFFECKEIGKNLIKKIFQMNFEEIKLHIDKYKKYYEITNFPSDKSLNYWIYESNLFNNKSFDNLINSRNNLLNSKLSTISNNNNSTDSLFDSTDSLLNRIYKEPTNSRNSLFDSTDSLLNNIFYNKNNCIPKNFDF